MQVGLWGPPKSPVISALPPFPSPTPLSPTLRWGFVSDKVGAVLRLKFSSMLPEGSGHDTGTQASLRLAYLKTYEHVGVFSVTCISGCNCTAQKVREQPPLSFLTLLTFFPQVNGHVPEEHVSMMQLHQIYRPHSFLKFLSLPSLFSLSQVNCHVPEEHVSLMQLHQISATQSPVCVMEVRIEAETTSGEHKVRAMQFEGVGRDCLG